MSNLNADYSMLKKTTIDYLLRLKNQETPNDIKHQFLEPYKVFELKIFIFCLLFVNNVFLKQRNSMLE